MSLSPLQIALGYGWRCPYCLVPQDEGNMTGIYYNSRAVCKKCAPILGALREAAEKSSS